MELTWKASESASALYAANCLSAGLPIADTRFAEAFAPALDVALAEFAACGAPADRLWPILTGLAARGVEDNRQLVEQGLTKLVGSRSPLAASIGRLAGAIGGLEAAYHNAYHTLTTTDSRPLVDELLVRGRPLLEQWEARGPGLLLHIARSTDENVLAAAADIVLVLPLVGGNGISHRSLNAVTFEAVLTNPVDELPEVLRLAWLLSQLNLDLPMYSDHVTAAHREIVGEWAMIPPVLSAAEYVELSPYSAEAVIRTLVAWRLVDASDATDAIAAQADTLMTWWHTCQESRTPWAIALAALEHMLFPGSDRS